MIGQAVTCDLCMKKCEDGVWYQIYRNEGQYYTGKVTQRVDVCNDCFGKMWDKIKGEAK